MKEGRGSLIFAGVSAPITGYIGAETLDLISPMFQAQGNDVVPMHVALHVIGAIAGIAFPFWMRSKARNDDFRRRYDDSFRDPYGGNRSGPAGMR